jgi:hypothetical protein
MKTDYSTRKKYLTINSVERIHGTPSDFIVQLRHPIRENQIELIECFIPNTFYNITDNNNGININGNTILITPGNYNLDELFEQIVNDIEPISSLTFDDTLSQLTINSSNITVSFPDVNSIHSVLGFPQNYNVTGTTFISSYGPSLTYYNVYIEINELSSNHMTTNPFYHAPTFIVSNSVNKNSIIPFYQKSQYDQFAMKKDNSQILQNLTIRLKNQFGSVLIGVGEWSMVLSIC